MGAVHFSIDTKLIERLNQLLPLTTFVETGTYQGDTVVRALPFFDKLYSVERTEEHYRAAVQRLAGEDSVELRHADSAEFLGELAPALRGEPVLYWLDAHWCASSSSPKPGPAQCPLLRELAAIETLNTHSVVLIDDARYFLAPPPAPNDPTQWPAFDQVLRGLRNLSSEHEVSVSNDVIIFSPKGIGDELRTFLQHHELDWLAVMDRAEDRDRQLAEIAQALQEAESDRSSRLAAIQALREGLQLSEADRAARLDVVNDLNKQLAESETDRAARLETINTMQEQLQASEADRAARLETIDTLQEQLQACEADRSVRLETIHTLQGQLQTSETDRAARLETINTLQEQLQTSETDRAARLDVINELNTRLAESEADRAARLGDIEILQQRLQASEAERTALLEVTQGLQSSLNEWESDRAASLARKLSSKLRNLRRKRPG